MKLLYDLSSWYLIQCNGEWEQTHHASMHTFTNPGWCLQVDLEKTKLEGRPFKEVKIDYTENDWIDCYVREGQFKGYGGPTNLPEILNVFLHWANDLPIEKALATRADPSSDDDFMWLLNWFHSQCDTYWEGDYGGIHIETLIDPGWYVSIPVNETPLENMLFETVSINRSKEDWVKCWVSDRKFQGRGGIFNLPEILGNFRGWAKEFRQFSEL